MSFRIDIEVLKEITRDASLNEISLNTLVNQILHKYVEFGRYQHRVGIIPAPRQVLMDIINDCGNKEIKVLAERTYGTLKDAVIFMQKRQDLLSFLHALEEYTKVAGIASDHRINGSKHTFVIQHDMGLKWSEFTRKLLSIILEKLANKRADFEITESSVIASFEL